MASCNSANVLTSIRSGEEGILSKVNQPARWAATWARDQHMFGTIWCGVGVYVYVWNLNEETSRIRVLCDAHMDNSLTVGVWYVSKKMCQTPQSAFSLLGTQKGKRAKWNYNHVLHCHEWGLNPRVYTTTGLEPVPLDHSGIMALILPTKVLNIWVDISNKMGISWILNFNPKFLPYMIVIYRWIFPNSLYDDAQVPCSNICLLICNGLIYSLKRCILLHTNCFL